MNQEVELVVLSGSTHAEKAALDMHTLIVSACTNFAVAEGIQGVFSNTCMRVYTNIDVKKRNKQQLVSDYGIRIYIKEKYFMRFSVVIPLYNKERYIQNTIESVLQQTFTDFEVIVVNDGSTDNSLSIAENIKSDKLRIISQENAGVAVARNTGINYANAEYVAFLDADDYWHSNYLEEINKLIDDFPESNIFVTSYRIIMGKKKYRSSAHLSEEPILLPSYWMTFKSAYDVVWTSVTTIRKEAILKAGLFTPGEEIGQDLDLWSRVARDNPKVAYSPEVCADYNRNAEQNARTRVKIAYPKAFLRVLEQEMENPQWSIEEKKWMENKYNKKMMVYIFTSIIAGKRKEARRILGEWNKKHSYKFVPFLYISSYCPNFLNKFVYSIRLKVF